MRSIVHLLFVLFFFALLPLSSNAGHILGGDLSVQHVQGNTFEARLQLFRDCNSEAAELDGALTIAVYEEGTDILQPDLGFSMNLGDDFIQPLGDDCFMPSICLQIGVYEEEIELPDNENGYYLVWERCCRSVSITNLFNPADLGIVFVATVPDPALQNSSPEFGEYPTDGYFCATTFNQFSYAATDADGDSLVYILEPPMYGLSATMAIPNPGGGGAKPTYQFSDYEPPFTAANPIGGAVPLAVDSETGLITASPDLLGIFSFALRIDEYRDGVKIGEIRREITLESTVCTIDLEPDFAGFEIYDTLYLTAFFENAIPVVINDNATDTVWQTFGGDIFDPTLYDIPAVYDTIAVQDGLFSGVINWDNIGCDYVSDDPYEVIFVANSINECSGVQSSDTLFLSLYVQLPDDQPTLLQEPMDFSHILQVVAEDNECISVTATDPNYHDSLSLFTEPMAEIFTVEDSASFFPVSGTNSVSSDLCWNVQCEHVREAPYIVPMTILTKRCFTTDTIQFDMELYVQTTSDGTLQIVPNVFTPNDDDINKEWELQHVDDVCRINKQVRVFNRWGTQVFDTRDLREYWQGDIYGNPASDGQYFYMIDYSWLDQEFEYVGPVTIFR